MLVLVSPRDTRGSSAHRSPHAVRLLPIGVVPPQQRSGFSPPSPAKATHCPHPTEGTRVGCGAAPEVVEQGGEHLTATPQAADLGLCCRPCSMGKRIWQGPWLMCERYQHPLSELVEGSAGQGAARIPCWLSIPPTCIPLGSGSTGLAPAPRKRPGRGGASLLAIHHPYQPALAARRSLAAGLHGRRAGAMRRETGGRRPGDKPRRKQKQQLSSLGTSKHRAEIYASAEPSWVLGGWGQPRWEDAVPGPWFAHTEPWSRQCLLWDVNRMQARSKASCPALRWAQPDKSSSLCPVAMGSPHPWAPKHP